MGTADSKPKSLERLPKSLLSSADTIGRLRDSVLVLIGVTYFMGYLLWSCVAWIRGIGFLPIVDYQYLSAGFIPLVCSVLALLVLYAISFSSLRIRILLLITVFILLVINEDALSESFLLHQKSIKNQLRELSENPTLAIIAMINFLFIISIFPFVMIMMRFLHRNIYSKIPVVRTISSRSLELNDRYGLSERLMYVLQTIITTIVVSLAVFISMPVEFGGPALRCARLDIDSSWYSKSTLTNIDVNVVGAETERLQTGPVCVAFASSSQIFIKTEAAMIELVRDGVSSAAWVECAALERNPCGSRVKMDG